MSLIECPPIYRMGWYMLECGNGGRCGLECGTCSWKEPCNCPGCMKVDGKVFWGQCKIAVCCIEKSLEHCGFCEAFPCDNLQAFAYDKEHGDPEGSRIVNLRKRLGS